MENGDYLKYGQKLGSWRELALPDTQAATPLSAGSFCDFRSQTSRAGLYELEGAGDLSPSTQY